MTKYVLAAVLTVFAAPAFAHPGGAEAHEHLSAFAHIVVTAVPFAVAAGLIGLLAYGYRRKA